MKTEIYDQQGDVLFFRLNGIPTGTKKKQDRVLVEGEVTGHKHQVIWGDCEVFENSNSEVFMRVGDTGALIGHDDHKVSFVEEGEHRIGIVQEYDHFAEEARAVTD